MNFPNVWRDCYKINKSDTTNFFWWKSNTRTFEFSHYEFLPQIDSNPQPMSYFRPQEEVGCETSMAIEFIKLCNPISLVTCSRRDKCLFNFQHHWNAVHRVRPRSSELCNWMPYSVGLLHIVCTSHIHTYLLYIHTIHITTRVPVCVCKNKLYRIVS